MQNRLHSVALVRGYQLSDLPPCVPNCGVTYCPLIEGCSDIVASRLSIVSHYSKGLGWSLLVYVKKWRTLLCCILTIHHCAASVCIVGGRQSWHKADMMGVNQLVSAHDQRVHYQQGQLA